MKNLSWQQFAALLACLAAPVGAHYLGGPLAGQVTAAASVLFAWLTASPLQPPGPPSAPSLSLIAGVTALALAITACGALSLNAQDVTSLEVYQQGLAACQDVGKDAGSYAAYANCVDAGGF